MVLLRLDCVEELKHQLSSNFHAQLHLSLIVVEQELIGRALF